VVICKLCQKHFIDETTFLNLFVFHDLCEQCRKTYKPKILFEKIPIDFGLIHYTYLFEDCSLNTHYEDYLSPYLSMIYERLLDVQGQYDLFIYLDDDMFYKVNEFTCFLNDYQDIFIFTLARKEVIYQWLL